MSLYISSHFPDTQRFFNAPNLIKRGKIEAPIGWILCYGFFHNCVIAPYFKADIIDWEQLLTSLGIMLGISGVRDIGMFRREIKNDKYDKPDKFDKKV